MSISNRLHNAAHATSRFTVGAFNLLREWNDSAYYTTMAGIAVYNRSPQEFLNAVIAREFARMMGIVIRNRRQTGPLMRELNHQMERARYIPHDPAIAVPGVGYPLGPDGKPVKNGAFFPAAIVEPSADRMRLFIETMGPYVDKLAELRKNSPGRECTSAILSVTSGAMSIGTFFPGNSTAPRDVLFGTLCGVASLVTAYTAGWPKEMARHYHEKLFDAPRKTGVHPNQTDKLQAWIHKRFGHNAPQVG